MRIVEPPLPGFLKAAFEAGTIEGASSALVAVDAAGLILWVNDGWLGLARRNGLPDLPASCSPGRSYFDGISEELRGYYQAALRNALATGEPFEQEYECSSEDTFRVNHLRVLPFGSEGLLLEHSVVVERPETFPESAAVDERYRDGHGLLLQCSNCRRVKHREDGAWHWVRAWVRAVPANTSHGICRSCIGYYWGTRTGAAPR